MNLNATVGLDHDVLREIPHERRRAPARPANGYGVLDGGDDVQVQVDVNVNISR